MIRSGAGGRRGQGGVSGRFSRAASGPVASFDFLGANPSLTSPQGITLGFTRASTAWRYNSTGTLVQEAINAPRWNYDPTWLEPKGLQIEQQATNLLLQSNNFGNAAWAKMDATITTANATGPDGTLSSDSVVEGATNTAVIAQNSAVFTTTAIATHSLYIKRGNVNWVRLRMTDGATNLTGGQAWFNLATGQKGTVTNLMAGTGFTASIQYCVAQGFYRISITGAINAGSTSARFEICSADADNSLLRQANATYSLWNAQTEVNTYASSPIITTAATATRATDLTSALVGSWYNAQQGTVVVEAQSDAPNNINFQYLYSFDDTTTNNRIAGNFQTVTNSGFVVATGGAVQANILTGSVTIGNYTKVAHAYQVNDFATSVNGGTVGTDTAGSVPTITTWRLGAAANGVGLNGHIRKFAYYNTRKSNADLITLTKDVTPSYWVTASNHTGVPQDLLFVEDTNPVVVNAIKRTAGPGGYSRIKPQFSRMRLGQNTELDANHDCTAEYGIRYNGTVYKANGGAALTLLKNGTSVWFDPIPGLVIAPFGEYWSITKCVALDAATAQTTVTAATQANPVVITIGAGHSYLDGQKVRFVGVGGMTQLNYASNGSVQYVVKNPTATTFELYNNAGTTPINGTAYGAFTSGGTANRVYVHYNIVLTTSITQDGCIRTTNAAIDQYAVPNSARVNKVPTISGGVITGVSVAAPGSNYAGGGNLSFFTGTAVVGDAAQEKPGSGLVGTFNQTAGAVTSTTISNGGSGFDPSNPAEMYIGGSNNTTNGFGGNLHAFGPIADYGWPAIVVPNQWANGDSILAGGGGSFASNNGVMPDGSVGVLERYYSRLGGFLKMGINGESLTGWNANNTRMLALIDSAIANGVRFSQALLEHAANDFRTSTTVTSATMLARVQTFLTTASTRCTYGAIVCTPLPSTLSNSAGPLYFTTQPEQISGAFANYDAGGSVDQYRAALINGTHGLTGLAAVLDWSAPVSDASSGLTRFASGVYGANSALTYNEPAAPGQSVHLNGAGQRRVYEGTQWIQPIT